MSMKSERQNARAADAPVPFAEKYAVSPQFNDLYREGMALVEDAASYLDGPGRRASRQLTGKAGLAYSTESMRLTTKLMQIASWLLVRRSVGRGEMTLEEAMKSRRRAKLTCAGKPKLPDGFDELPEELQDLVHKCDSLYDRILRLDRLISLSNDRAPSAADNPVGTQVNRLKQAFGAESTSHSAVAGQSESS